jgi:hypothetical protein
MISPQRTQREHRAHRRNTINSLCSLCPVSVLSVIKKCSAVLIQFILAALLITGIGMCESVLSTTASFGHFQKKSSKKNPPVATTSETVPENYFPLNAGNYWLYRAKVEIGNDKGGTDKIDKPKRVQVVSINGDNARRIIQLKTEDYNGSNLITYSIRGGKIYQFDELDNIGAEKQNDLPDDKLRYVFPLSINRKWREPENAAANKGLYCYIVEGLEEVTVPAGTFHDCYRIAFRTIADESIEWFFPNVGIVKSTYHHNGSVDDELYELESYKVGVDVKTAHTKGNTRR